MRIVQTMHEFKQLVHDSFEEAPVCTEETRVLPNDIHDVRRNDCFVVLASFLFTQTQQLLDTHAYSRMHTLMANVSISSIYLLAIQLTLIQHYAANINHI